MQKAQDAIAQGLTEVLETLPGVTIKFGTAVFDGPVSIELLAEKIALKSGVFDFCFFPMTDQLAPELPYGEPH